MKNDYLITIFSRDKGKTSTFSLNRRLVYVLTIMLIFLVASSIILGQAYFQERGERQRLEKRIGLLEQLMGRSEERSERKDETAVKEVKVEPEAQLSSTNEAIRRGEEEEAAGQSGESVIESSYETKADTQAIVAQAKIDDAKVTALEGDQEGFRIDFRLVNLIDKPISGNVAIIASLKSPHKPRFVSFPTMKLVDGVPVKLRKSVGFDIRYYKYVTGRFHFPFSYSESFRILVYNRDEALILDSVLPAGEVAARKLISEEQTEYSDSS
jgi:hypothetical protein